MRGLDSRDDIQRDGWVEYAGRGDVDDGMGGVEDREGTSEDTLLLDERATGGRVANGKVGDIEGVANGFNLGLGGAGECDVEIFASFPEPPRAK